MFISTDTAKWNVCSIWRAEHADLMYL